MPAVIYQFPVGGRAGLAGTKYETKPSVVTLSASPSITPCGSAWYHEEAMKEEERTRKN